MNQSPGEVRRSRGGLGHEGACVYRVWWEGSCVFKAVLDCRSVPAGEESVKWRDTRRSPGTLGALQGTPGALQASRINVWAMAGQLGEPF